jgi:hypothetical protein
MIDKQNKPLTTNSPQELQNDSFDREFGVAVAENLVFNPVTSTLDRMVQPGQELPDSGVNPSMTVTTSVVGTVTTTTLTKTIDSTSYVKTIEEDSSDDSIVISAWSEV